MPQTLTLSPTDPSYPDGYYVVAAYTLDKFGRTNLDNFLDMENVLSSADKLAAWNRAVASVEGWWDALLRSKFITADADATSPHVMGATNADFLRVRQLLSIDMGPETYFARGHTGDTNEGAEGQMTQTRKDARDELERIAETMRVTQAQDAGTNGAEVITVGGCASARCNVVLPVWGWW